MKKINLIKKISIIFSLVLIVSSCTAKQQQQYYFESLKYAVDYDDSCRVMYIKSYKQLSIYNCSNPRIYIDTSDHSYDITLHLHQGNDSTLTVSSRFELNDIGVSRFRILEKRTIDSTRSILILSDSVGMVKSVSRDCEFIYTVELQNYNDIDFLGGEIVVFEYDNHVIQIPPKMF